MTITLQKKSRNNIITNNDIAVINGRLGFIDVIGYNDDGGSIAGKGRRYSINFEDGTVLLFSEKGMWVYQNGKLARTLVS